MTGLTTFLLALLSGILPGWLSAGTTQLHGRTHFAIGLASVFHETGDPSNPNPTLACDRRLRNSTAIKATGYPALAHNGLPCGTIVTVCTLPTVKRIVGTCAQGMVLEKGAMKRASLDLSTQLAQALGYGKRRGFNGLEKVLYVFNN